MVATGGTPIIEVLENNTKINIVSALEIFYGKKIYGKNVVVLGGGLTGAEVADHMAFLQLTHYYKHYLLPLQLFQYLAIL